MASKKRKGGHEEEHENSERWLVTYADMITLLMVLFIVMFSMSQVDQRKFNALKSGLAAGFGQSTSMLDGSNAVLDESGISAVEAMQPPSYSKTKDKIDQVKIDQAVADQLQKANERRHSEAAAEVDRLSGVAARLKEALAERGLTGDVRTVIDGRGLTVSLLSEHVVFNANLATLTPRGQHVVDTLAPVLRALPDKLQIDGHTNQMGKTPKYYKTDWDLAAARAVTVLRRLNEHGHVPASRLSAASYGQERPLVDPAKPGSQKLNKRVDIVVLSGLPDETADLVNLAAKERAQKAKERTQKEG